jgi:hypothetical protein
MEKTARILGGYVEESQFAADNDIHLRTSARYRNLPNGLPYIEWGGKIYIHIEGARAWLRSRAKSRNPSRAHPQVTAA